MLGRSLLNIVYSLMRKKCLIFLGISGLNIFLNNILQFHFFSLSENLYIYVCPLVVAGGATFKLEIYKLESF